MRLALIGKMFSGKTTAARYLVDTYNFHHLSFGDGVKENAAAMLNAFCEEEDLPPNWTLDTINANKANPIVRHLLQFTGGEIGRQLIGDEYMWIDKVLSKVGKIEAKTPEANIVIDDCRYENEYDVLKAAGFTIVRVQQSDLNRMTLMQKRYPNTWQAVASHPSETSLDNHSTDAIINAATVKELHRKLDALIH